MSSEALREAKAWLEAIASADPKLVRPSGLAAALLAEVARLERAAEHAEQQRAEYAKAWVDQQYRLQASTAALADLLDTMERGDEYKAFERMTAARAALVDEPAAAEQNVAPGLASPSQDLRFALIRCAEIAGESGEAVEAARSGAMEAAGTSVAEFAIRAVEQLRQDMSATLSQIANEKHPSKWKASVMRDCARAALMRLEGSSPDLSGSMSAAADEPGETP